MESLNDQWSYYQEPADFQNSLLNVGGQAEGIGVSIQLQPIQPGSATDCPEDRQRLRARHRPADPGLARRGRRHPGRRRDHGRGRHSRSTA